VEGLLAARRGGDYRKRQTRQQGHEPRGIIKDHVHLTQDLIGQNILYPYPIISFNIITEQVIDLIRSQGCWWGTGLRKQVVLATDRFVERQRKHTMEQTDKEGQM
jgi:hypothetical protein